MKQKCNTWKKRPCVRFNTTRKTSTKTPSLISKLQCKKFRSTNKGRHLPPTLHFSGFFFFPPFPAKCFFHHTPPSHFIFKIQISIYKNTVYFKLRRGLLPLSNFISSFLLPLSRIYFQKQTLICCKSVLEEKHDVCWVCQMLIRSSPAVTFPALGLHASKSHRILESTNTWAAIWVSFLRMSELVIVSSSPSFLTHTVLLFTTQRFVLSQHCLTGTFWRRMESSYRNWEVLKYYYSKALPQCTSRLCTYKSLNTLML